MTTGPRCTCPWWCYAHPTGSDSVWFTEGYGLPAAELEPGVYLVTTVRPR
jgi:hypothetical protein